MKVCVITFLAATLSLFPGFGQEQTPLNIALQYFEREHKQWNLTPEDIDGMKVSDQYRTKHNGVTHLYFLQQHRGIAVHNAVCGIHIAADGSVAYATSRFVARLGEKVNAYTPSISAQEALRRAAALLDLTIGEPVEVIGSRGKTELTLSKAGIARRPIRARLVYRPMGEEQVRLAWDLSIDQAGTSDYWSLQIDAEDGTLLEKGNFTVYCRSDHDLHHDHQAHCFEEESRPAMAFRSAAAAPVDGSSYFVFPMPVESPLHGSRNRVTDPADPEASPYGWHDTDGQPGPEYTFTRGNNVHAFFDPANTDISGSDEPDGKALLLFDFPFEENLEPSKYRDASVTQLFYTTNMMHDLAYRYGFDEAAGNFQENNYDRGGSGGDPVIANAQDGGEINSASFTAPPEGETGKMELNVWTTGGHTLFSITAPSAVAGYYNAGTADFGPPVSTSAVAGEIALAFDNSGSPNRVCGPVVNRDEVKGRIAMIERGVCFFEEKVKNAEDAGAIAVIICNVEDDLTTMGGVDDIQDPGIPSVILRSSDCQRIRQYVGRGAAASLQLKDLSGPDSLDASFDNGIIAHEYAHGISIRLTGGPANSRCLSNDEQMGEGWSDFFTLVTTFQPGAAGKTPRGIGNYVLRNNLSSSGVRRQPYSTDMSVNTLVFDDIIGTGHSPHDVGEVWAAMLWDLYWRFIEAYGWDDDLINGSGGNNMAIQLIVDALKLQACQPGFIDGRNAILKADELNYGGDNQCLIWEVFARRGLGAGAGQGAPDNRNDGFQSFDLKPECIRELKIAKRVTELIDPGDEITVSLTVTNHKDEAVSGIVVADQLPEGTAYIGGSLTGQDVEAPEISEGLLRFRVGDIDAGGKLLFSYRLSTRPDRRSVRQFFDDVENGDGLWTLDALTGSSPWDLSEADAFSGNTSWFVPNTNGENDQVLQPADPVRVGGIQPVLRFYHRYDTEPGTDGGLLEVSADGGASWETVPREKIFKNSYRGRFDYLTFSIPQLEGYWGDSRKFIDSYVDLGDYRGQEIYFRFRFGSVANTANNNPDVTGWFVDDIELMDMYNYNSEACVSSDQGDLACAEAPYRGTVVQTGEFTAAADPVEQPLGMMVYPNPAGDWINVALRTAAPAEATLSLLGMDGRLLRQSRVSLSGGEQLFPLPAADLPAGVYLVRVQTEKSTSAVKVIVRRF